jgi:hypothetical protein
MISQVDSYFILMTTTTSTPTINTKPDDVFQKKQPEDVFQKKSQ